MDLNLSFRPITSEEGTHSLFCLPVGMFSGVTWVREGGEEGGEVCSWKGEKTGKGTELPYLVCHLMILFLQPSFTPASLYTSIRYLTVYFIVILVISRLIVPHLIFSHLISHLLTCPIILPGLSITLLYITLTIVVSPHLLLSLTSQPRLKYHLGLYCRTYRHYLPLSCLTSQYTSRNFISRFTAFIRPFPFILHPPT